MNLGTHVHTINIKKLLKQAESEHSKELKGKCLFSSIDIFLIEKDFMCWNDLKIKSQLTLIFVVAVRKLIYLFCHCMLILILCYLISQRWGASCVRAHLNRLLRCNNCVFSHKTCIFFFLTVTLHNSYRPNLKWIRVYVIV